MRIRVLLFGLSMWLLSAAVPAQTWEMVHSQANINLFSLLFLNDSIGFCAGGTIDEGIMLKTTDGGESWTPTGPAGAKLFYSVRQLSDSLLLTTGYGGEIWRSTTAGESWVKIISPGNAWLTGSYALGPNTMVACGLDGTIWRTANQGSNWVVQNSGTQSWLLDAHFLNAQIGYVCGTSDMLLRTQNGGQNWARIPSPANGTYHSVWNFSRDTIYLATSAGFVMRSYTSGESWSNFFLGSMALRRLYFQDQLHGWVVGNRCIFSTDNGGNTWQNEKADSPPLIEWLDIKRGPGKFIYVCGRDGHIIRKLSILSQENLPDMKLSASAWPNPARIRVSFPCPEPPCRVRMSNLSGAVVWEGVSALKTGNIHRGDWASGTYILEVQHVNGTYTSKIIWE